MEKTTYHMLGQISPDTNYAETFYRSYGYAMVEWARVEDNLARWFETITEMPAPMARAVLNSAKAFTPQALMLSSAIENAPLKREIADFLKAAIDKALTYYQFRNRIAHGMPRINTTDPNNPVFEWHESKSILSLDPITRERIDICAKNFGDLANAIMTAYLIASRSPEPRERRLKELQRQVFLLPNPADRPAPSQSQLGKLRQREQKPSKKGQG
ncbi:MAG: hypothetical protein E5W21_07655 [Mesorhizobium sp.]|nr:MAG: hypothetical protein E5W21_07655 [Mesorhizobium sp.]